MTTELLFSLVMALLIGYVGLLLAVVCAFRSIRRIHEDGHRTRTRVLSVEALEGDVATDVEKLEGDVRVLESQQERMLTQVLQEHEKRLGKLERKTQCLKEPEPPKPVVPPRPFGVSPPDFVKDHVQPADEMTFYDPQARCDAAVVTALKEMAKPECLRDDDVLDEAVENLTPFPEKFARTMSELRPSE